MLETLTKVKESIASCEKIKIENPEYYNIYWKFHHKLLLQIEKELVFNQLSIHLEEKELEEKEEIKEMLDEETEAYYKKAEELTKGGLNFYDALATLRENK